MQRSLSTEIRSSEADLYDASFVGVSIGQKAQTESVSGVLGSYTNRANQLDSLFSSMSADKKSFIQLVKESADTLKR